MRTHCLLCGRPGEPLHDGMRDRICGTPGSWAILECSGCSFAWLGSEPADEPHGDGYYTHTESADRLMQAAAVSPGVRAVLRQRLRYPSENGEPGLAARLSAALPLWAEHCEAHVLFLPSQTGGRLLDVGCGTGVFAARMRLLGWDVTCVEPDPQSAAIARDVFGLRVHNGTLEDAQLEAGAFDAITLSHVIEHVPDPIATLTECRRLLRPGGVLAALTPNIRSLGRRVFGEHWMHWDVPRHRYLFSTTSLAETARRAQLQPVQVRTSARAARWAWHRSRELARGAVIDEANGGSARGPAALGFAMLEGALARWSDAGEECLLVATVAGDG